LWNLGKLWLKNPILSLAKQTPTYQSLEVSSLKNKGRTWNPNPIQHAHIYATRPSWKLDPMEKGIETLANLFHELHHWSNDEEILVGDTLPNMFFRGTCPHNLGEVVETAWTHDTSFLVWGNLSPTPTKVDTISQGLAPFLIASLKSLEDCFFSSKDFA
jgi:hypothetical protein